MKTIVAHSYNALRNLGYEQGYNDFGTFIREYFGQTGSSTVINYEPLNNNTDYVLVLFYMDPNSPTNVYDLNTRLYHSKHSLPHRGIKRS